MTPGGETLDDLFGFDVNAPLTEQEKEDLLVPADAKEKRPCPKCGKVLTWTADGKRPRAHKCKEVAADIGQSQCAGGCGTLVPNSEPGVDVICMACAAKATAAGAPIVLEVGGPLPLNGDVGMVNVFDAPPAPAPEDLTAAVMDGAAVLDMFHQAPSPAPEGPTVDEVVAKYVATRDLIAEKTKALAKELETLVEFQKKREAWLAGKLDALGGESMRAPHGTFYFEHTSSVTVSDGVIFLDWVHADWNNRRTFLNNAANKTAVDQRVNENNQPPPPGVNYTTVRKLKVRRA